MVETGAPHEQCRWVFPRLTPALRRLGDRITAPRLILKLCDTTERLAAALPDRWQVAPTSHVMMIEAPLTTHVAPPPGFRVQLQRQGAVHSVAILSPDGRRAASGHAAETDEVFVFDRIVTAEGFRRIGLGSIVMASLAATRRSSGARCVLVATQDGRALYTRLGWSIHSPYASASIPGPSAG